MTTEQNLPEILDRSKLLTEVNRYDKLRKEAKKKLTQDMVKRLIGK